MKKLLLLVLFFIPVVAPSVAQNGFDLFQQALVKERSEGDLDAAISLYRRVADETEDRSLAAKALMQLGRAYEKLGRDEAARAYEQIVEGYSDQQDVASQAKSRLQALRISLAAVPAHEKRPRTMTVRKVADLDLMGRPSPDGRYISYVNWAYGNLAVYDAQTGERRDLTSDGSWEKGRTAFSDVSVWSPDSRRLAFMWIRSLNDKQIADLRIVDVESGADQTLVSGADVTQFAWPVGWSRDGRHILSILEEFGEDGHDGDEIALVDAQSGAYASLKQFPEGIHTLHMAYSPDGRHIAYEVREQGSENVDIHIMAADGSLDRPLIVHPSVDEGPEWTGDGRHLIFASNRTGSTGLWAAEVADGRLVGEPRLLREGLGRHFSAKGFTDDGTYFYGGSRATQNIFTMRLNPDGSDPSARIVGSPEKVSMRNEGMNRAPFWSPDGKRLAYLSDRGGRMRAEVMVLHDVSAGIDRDVQLPILAPERIAQWAWPQWWPDGSAVLLNGGGNSAAVHRIDLETGDAVRLMDEEPAWKALSPDGEHLIFVRGSDIIARQLPSGTETVLHEGRDYVYRLSLSPDGTRLAFFEGDNVSEPGWQRDLLVMPLDRKADGVLLAKEPLPLWKGSADEYFSWDAGLSWLHDGRHVLLATEGRDNAQQFYLVDAESGERKAVGARLTGDRRMREVRAHPAEPVIVFSRGSTVSELWSIENLLTEEASRR